MDVHIAKRKLTAGLLEPINPYLAIVAAFLNILYGTWNLLPDATVPRATIYLEHVVPEGAWGGVLVALGIGMILAFRYWNVASVSNFMALNGVVWSILSALVFFGDWHSGIFIQFGVIAVYSIFVSANLKVNFVPEHKKAIKNEKFVR